MASRYPAHLEFEPPSTTKHPRPFIRRCSLLAGSLILLLLALLLLWQHRYERIPGAPGWGLADLRPDAPAVAGAEWLGTGENSKLRLHVGPQSPQVALRLALPGAALVHCLHLRFRMQARGLTPGPEKWQTGRLIIEWHPPDASAEPELDSVGGIKDDLVAGSSPMVAMAARGPALPALRLEHLGRAGEFVLSDLEILPVRERVIWRYGRWVLVAGFLSWLYGCTRIWPALSRRRCLLAALMWLGMGLHFVIPGPWKSQYPLLVGFRLGPVNAAQPFSQAPPMVEAPSASRIQSGAVAATGNILPQGSLALRIKIVIAKARPLLHVLLLLAPTLASAWLIGRHPTLLLAILFTLAVEASQIAFGYGFDWIDIADLLTDATGIALGLWLARRCPIRC